MTSAYVDSGVLSGQVRSEGLNETEQMTEVRRSSATTRKGEDRRAAILSAAAGLFAEQGYRGASLESVAAAAGLTRAGLLHYFGSKEAMLLALLEDRYHVDGRRLSGGLTGDGLTLMPALQRIVEHNQQSVEAVKLFSVLVAESIFDGHPGHDHFERRYERIRGRLTSVLEEERAAGLIRTDVDLALLVPVIVAVMDGLQIQWLLDQRVDMVASFALFSDLLRTALAPDRR